MPTFIDAEPHYMGRVAWVFLMGLLTGREAEAVAFVEMVAQEVDRLKSLARAQPRRSVLWAWYRSAGNRWAVTQRNADGALIRDANVELVLGAEDDPELDVGDGDHPAGLAFGRHREDDASTAARWRVAVPRTGNLE